MYRLDQAARLNGAPVLAGLPATEMAELSPHLSSRTFARGSTIIGPGGPNECHFVRGGLIAILFGALGGEQIGVSLLGFDGFLGIGPLLGISEVAHSAVALTTCSTLCLSPADLRRTCEANSELRQRLLQ